LENRHSNFLGGANESGTKVVPQMSNECFCSIALIFSPHLRTLVVVEQEFLLVGYPRCLCWEHGLEDAVDPMESFSIEVLLELGIVGGRTYPYK
jgi:hypothetical protein